MLLKMSVFLRNSFETRRYAVVDFDTNIVRHFFENIFVILIALHDKKLLISKLSIYTFQVNSQ